MPTILAAMEITSPLGPLLAVASDRGLCALDHAQPQRRALLVARCARWYGTEEIIPQENRHLTRAQEWLDAYFSRAWDSLPTLTLDQRGSEFELRVWQALQRVPLGQVMSYGELATRINQTGSARAVGGAAGRNPLAIIVPCHRIIGAGGSLTGYAGGLDSKSWLLSHETDL